MEKLAFLQPLSPISTTARDQLQAKLDNLAKPIRGLGRLEELAIDIAGIQQTADIQVAKRTCLVYVADNGVVVEGVSATSEPITNILADNIADGHAAVSALAIARGCEVKVYDVGLAGPHHVNSKLIDKRIKAGTNDILKAPAMSREEAIQSIKVGYDTALEAIEAGTDLLLIGEAGLGNTTLASAIVATMLNVPVADVVSAGSHVKDATVQNKLKVVETAVKQWQPDATDPIDVLSKLGAFELGAKTGAILCAAEHGVPLILDGFLSDTSALLAEAIQPGVTQHLIASHSSKESGANRVLEYLGLKPYLDFNLAAGEGTGAVMLLAEIDDIQAVLQHMNRLEDLNFEYTN